MSLFKKKPKLPPIPRGAISQPAPESQQQGGREAIEVNGRLVWVDSSKTSERPKLSAEQEAEETRRLASEIKRKLGISDE